MYSERTIPESAHEKMRGLLMMAIGGRNPQVDIECTGPDRRACNDLLSALDAYVPINHLYFATVDGDSSDFSRVTEVLHACEPGPGGELGQTRQGGQNVSSGGIFIRPELKEAEFFNKKKKIVTHSEKNVRKRQRNKNREKYARGHGLEYVSYNGQTKPPKEMQVFLLCSEKCKLQCSEQFSFEERDMILKDFYSLDINSKNCLLFKSMRPESVARHRKNASKFKTTSYKYYVTVKESDRRVCKTAFRQLYQISNKKVEVIQKKQSSGESPTDQRGRHRNRPHKILVEVEPSVIEHFTMSD